jgi:membrane-bound ClpP family serine protease
MSFLLALLASINWPAIACIIIGIILVVIEMHIPGFGVPGIAGVILLVAGVIMFSGSVLEALILVIIILAILGIAVAVVYRSASAGKLSKHLILNDSLEKEDQVSFPSEDEISCSVGSEGKALTILRPAGSADFNGVKVDVISDGEFIPENALVVVTRIEGKKIIVKQKAGN